MEIEEKALIIKDYCLKEEKLINPIQIVKNIMNLECVNIHGPEHHIIDGASLLTAIYNYKKDFNLDKALDELIKRAYKMPGAMCGYFGVCGSATSIGAVLSIIHNTGPLSNDSYYKDNMELTSTIIQNMAKIGGPRCCKRNAFISLTTAIEFLKNKYNINLEKEDIICEYSISNKQCLKDKCPFHKE